MSIKTRRKNEKKRIKKELEKKENEVEDVAEEEETVFNFKHEKEPCNRRYLGHYPR